MRSSITLKPFGRDLSREIHRRSDVWFGCMKRCITTPRMQRHAVLLYVSWMHLSLNGRPARRTRAEDELGSLHERSRSSERTQLIGDRVWMPPKRRRVCCGGGSCFVAKLVSCRSGLVWNVLNWPEKIKTTSIEKWNCVSKQSVVCDRTILNTYIVCKLGLDSQHNFNPNQFWPKSNWSIYK